MSWKNGRVLNRYTSFLYHFLSICYSENDYKCSDMQNVIYSILQYVLQYGSAVSQYIAIRFLSYRVTPSWHLHAILLLNSLTTQSRHIMTQKKMALENTVGKGENAGIQHFLLFPHCFLLDRREKSAFQQHLICCLQML